MIHARFTKPLGWAIASTAVLCGMLSPAQETASDVPVLSLSQAVEVALEHNRPVNIAKLDIDKSKWTLAQTKTKRFPAINTYLFASGDITSPTFNFPAGSFGFQQPQKFKLSSGITGYASVQAAQPISQLYQIHLAIREQELSVDYSGEQYKGKRQSLAASVKQAYYAVLQTESALQVFQTDVGRYPTQSEGLAALTTAPPGVSGWNGPYSKPIPLDPWGHPYHYLIPGKHGEIDIYSLGSDNAEGGTGAAADIGNWQSAPSG